MSQPTGTVTFLFTDIEGSTKLWQQFPNEMGAALARHDEILQAEIEAADGYVFKTIGDAFCAAFHTAPSSLTAALNSQIALAREPWPEGIRITVRMALHTGAAEVRNEDYFGQPLNRVARLLGIGHGGQVLLSDVAQQLCRDVLPPATGMKSLGDHRLRDLGRPESVYQLLHPQLREEFPKLKSLDGMPGNLPQQLTSFVGRGEELADLQKLLAESRLATLTGSGGCGKTRLSLQIAADAIDAFEDGVWLVELAPVSDPEIVPQAVAGVLGAKELPGKSIQESLIEHLGKRPVMLILDNCEHLLDACARLANAVLRRCPNVVLLATSREALGIGGESVYRVPSLSVPDPKQTSTPASLSLFDSVRLFIDRARFHLSTFAVTDQNAPALASICHRLDGIPLAIELAAARVRSMSLDEINRRLDQRFRLLTGGSRAHLPRQQTLRSLIDWSYDLLSPPEQRLLARLSVFWGGWTLEAAEHVCSTDEDPKEDVLDLMLSLVDKSLVVADERDRAMRYRLLETIRQYGADRQAESGETGLEARHLTYFHDLAVEHAPDFRGPKQQEWTARLDVEHDNYRAALRWAIVDRHQLQMGLETAGDLWRFWYVRGNLVEGLTWLSTAEWPEAATLPAAVRAKALNGAGVMAWNRGDYPRAQQFHEESLAMHRELGDRRGIAISLNNLGIVLFDLGEYGQAEAMYGQAAEIFRELGESYGVASVLNAQGNAAFYTGRLDEALAIMEESLAIKREIGDAHGIGMSLTNLSLLNQELGRIDSARTQLAEASGIYRDIGDHLGIMIVMECQGLLVADGGDPQGGRELLFRALELANADGMPLRQATCFEGLASVDALAKQTRRAALLWGYASKIREEIGVTQAPPVRRSQDSRVAVARAALGDDTAFDAWWQEGRTLTPDQALALAMNVSSATP